MKSNTPAYYIGLMSGTSVDGVDAVLLRFDSDDQPATLLETHSIDFPVALAQEVHALTSAGTNEIARMAKVENQLADLYNEAVEGLLGKTDVARDQIVAIGNHGQTVRHLPAQGYTLQLGNQNLLAAKTGIDVIGDFRRADMALGGQGAPLVPAFHLAQFGEQHPNERVCVLNLGGIANVSVIEDGAVTGYDIGPANTLLDLWYRHNNSERNAQSTETFDINSQWAMSGKVNQELLESLLKEPYFTKAPPKSTGRELFNYDWLADHLLKLDARLIGQGADIQRTLLELTVQAIAISLPAEGGNLYLCGGGALNSQLVSLLDEALPNYKVSTTDDLGINPQWVEAAAFAWLAQRFTERRPGNVPSVTGASAPTVLGALFPAAYPNPMMGFASSAPSYRTPMPSQTIV